MKSEGIKITADDIVAHLKKIGFNRGSDVAVTEFCPYGEARRVDMFYFNRWNRETRGYEIKISRADFLSDKKWESYLKYCTWFYFVAPEGIIKKEELPEKVGLMEIQIIPRESYGSDEETNYQLRHKFTKTARRLQDVAEKEYIQLLEGLLIKLIYSKNLLK